MSEMITIGGWEFSPKAGVLSRDDQSHRLENRTASLLEYLCQSGGELVSHSEIIQHVWDGRSVSPNSVAVVIADLRRALDDDARDPTYVETIPKRGYRIIAQVVLHPCQAASPSAGESVTSGWQKLLSRPRVGFGLVALALLAVAALSQIFPQSRVPAAPILVSISAIENQTNDPQQSTLAIAITELISVELMRQGKFQLAQDGNAEIRISGQLILWDGHAALSLHAMSNNRTFWSGMAPGPEAALPRQVRTQISDFVEEVSAVQIGD